MCVLYWHSSWRVLQGDLDHSDAGADALSEEISDAMAKQFEDAMKSFMAQEPALMEQFQKLTTSDGQTGQGLDVIHKFFTLSAA